MRVNPDRPPGMRRSPAARTIALLCVAATLAGCGRMWASIRERDRRSAERTTQRLAERGQCERAIASAESAQAAWELGDFAAKSTWIKARCLDALERREQGLAHWRLLADFYPDSAWAGKIPPDARESIALRSASPRVAAPGELKLPKARYSESAERSHLIGTVVIEFTLDRRGSTRQIRVLENPHPLLSSWAIEAVARAELASESRPHGDLPIRSAVSMRFSSHWAEIEAEKAAEQEVRESADEGSASAPQSESEKEEKPFFRWAWDREE